MNSRIASAALVLAAAMILAPPLGAQSSSSSERLVIGEQKVVKPGYAVGDIAISNPQVCDFRVMGGTRRDVMLIANGAGFTTLTIWDQRGVKRSEIAIEVMSRELAKLQADLRELMRPYPNVTVKALGTRLVLAGTVDTVEDLEQIRAMSSADSNILCSVVVKSAGVPRTQAADPPDPGAPPAVSPPPVTPPPAGGVVVDPTPPPPTRRPAAGTTGSPVSLGGAAKPPVSAEPPPMPPPSGGVAAATPPPPNVTTGGRATPPPATGGWGTAVGTGSIEYLVEIYESPTSAPPPEVAGPQGKRLFQARLRTDVGREVRHMVTVGSAPNAPPAQMRGMSLGFTPRVTENTIETSMVVDTNLPIGDYEQKKNPVWLRCTVEFSTPNNRTRYVSEFELAATAQPAAAPPAAGGPSTGSRVAVGAAQTGVGVAASHAGTAGAFIPGIGSLFGGGGGGQPKARPTLLMIVVTPAIIGPIKDQAPSSGVMERRP